MNHFVEIREINISDTIEANKTENYPSSGLYVVRTDIQSDLRFVDKNNKHAYMICPETIYDKLELGVKELPKKSTGLIADVIPPDGFVSESFVLNFSRMLLSNKK